MKNSEDLPKTRTLRGHANAVEVCRRYGHTLMTDSRRENIEVCLVCYEDVVEVAKDLPELAAAS